MKLFKRCAQCFTIVLCLIVFAPCIFADPPESKEPIKIIINNWTSQIILAKIAGHVFKEMGYNIEYYTQFDTDKQWGHLGRGEYHVQMEVWEGTMAKMFNRLLELGMIVDAGSHNATTREEWWYPAYVEDMCPGLPKWEALRDCYSLFVVPETAPKGKYLGGPWEKPDMAMVRALGMNFKIVRVEKGDDLWVELDKAVKEKRPIVLFNWTPNWVEAKYEGKFVEFPEYAPECESDAEWGVSKKWAYDCGNPKDGWLKKAAWSGMEENWPCALAVLKNINFTNDMIAKVAVMVDYDKMTHDDAAAKWLEENESIWKAWIPESCSN